MAVDREKWRGARWTRALAPLGALLTMTAGCRASGSDGRRATNGPLSTIGLVTAVGGRGDRSLNDGALRGLEAWSCGVRPTASGYAPLSAADLAATLPADLGDRLSHLAPLPGLSPLVIEARSSEDYRPALGQLADRHVALAIGVGFPIEEAIAAEAAAHPQQRYLLVGSPLLDAQGKPAPALNVRTVTFQDQEGAFLAGVLAVGAAQGLADGGAPLAVGFVGGMQVPLIRRFEAGFRAGVAAASSSQAARVAVAYVGSFDDLAAGQRLAEGLYDGGVGIIFHAAGAAGVGVLAAAEAGQRWAIGVDSDRANLAPPGVLSSVVRHVDYAVYLAVRDLAAGKFVPGNQALGLAEGGVGLAPIGPSFPGRAEVEARLAGFRRAIAGGALRVPTTLAELAAAGQPPASAAPPAAAEPARAPQPAAPQSGSGAR